MNGNIISVDDDDWCGEEDKYESLAQELYFQYCIDSDSIGYEIVPAHSFIFPHYPNLFDSHVSIHYGLPPKFKCEY
ncbi:MAG: hypothetical protein QGF57_04805 [Candidatus Marinimicrobia bacterium]|nr:hypothetical protein [Candidatus Neomarinimicrobiota bacterium]